MRYNRFLGFSLAEIALVLIWEPLINWFNTSLPSDSVGTGLGTFFWLLMAVTFMYLMVQIYIELMGQF